MSRHVYTYIMYQTIGKKINLMFNFVRRNTNAEIIK